MLHAMTTEPINLDDRIDTQVLEAENANPNDRFFLQVELGQAYDMHLNGHHEFWPDGFHTDTVETTPEVLRRLAHRRSLSI